MRRQPAELARHVVRRRRHRSERRPPHDDLDVAEPHQVGQVRVAAGELRDDRLAPDVEAGHAARRQTLAQPRAEPRPIELFARPDLPGVRFHGEKAIMRAMRFDHSREGDCDPQQRLDAFMRRARLPERARVPPPDRRRRSLAADRDRRGAQAQGARRRPVEPVSAGERVRRRADQRRVRAALRDHGPRARLRTGSVQLLGAGHRQHGSAGALRHRGAAQAMARTAARRQDPVVLRDDRAGCRLVGRDQHPVADRARRRATT